jgi:hypothetical protein
MLLFHHVGKTSSIPPPAGGLTAAIVVVARWRKEYHVVAAVEGHELKTPKTEYRPGLEWLLETTHLKLDGKLFINTQQAPTWARQLSAFRPRGVPGPTSKLSLRVPAQMGRRETEHKVGKTAKGKPRPSCCPALRADALVVRGYKRSRGRERESESLVHRPVLPRGQPSRTRAQDLPFIGVRRGPRCTMGGCSNVLTCLAERSQSPKYMLSWLSERFWRPIHVMLWPSEERLSPMEVQLLGLSDPC